MHSEIEALLAQPYLPYPDQAKLARFVQDHVEWSTFTCYLCHATRDMDHAEDCLGVKILERLEQEKYVYEEV